MPGVQGLAIVGLAWGNLEKDESEVAPPVDNYLRSNTVDGSSARLESLEACVRDSSLVVEAVDLIFADYAIIQMPWKGR